MSLTTGRGPLGPEPAGRLDRAGPAGAVYVEPFLRRVRALVDGRTAIDTERALLVHRPKTPPYYAFPADAVIRLPTHPEPAALGYVRVPWEAASAWYEEEEEVFGHPRNPYHRVDCVRTRRRLRVEVAGEVLVDTADVIGVYETGRLPQLYVRPTAVRVDRLIPSPTSTHCPYKGTASHWTAVVGDTVVRDVAWSYDDPTPESAPIAGLLSFYTERAQTLQEVPGWFSPPPPAEVDPQRAHEERPQKERPQKERPHQDGQGG